MQRNADEIDEIKLQYANQISNLNTEILNIKEKSEVKETELNKQVFLSKISVSKNQITVLSIFVILIYFLDIRVKITTGKV